MDPINNEWYNYIHGNAGRTSQRYFVEISASTYEYCYANPVRFIDPTGEQAPPLRHFGWLIDATDPGHATRTELFYFDLSASPERHKTKIGTIIAKVTNPFVKAAKWAKQQANKIGQWVQDKGTKADRWVQLAGKNAIDKAATWFNTRSSKQIDDMSNFFSAGTFVLGSVAPFLTDKWGKLGILSNADPGFAKLFGAAGRLATKFGRALNGVSVAAIGWKMWNENQQDGKFSDESKGDLAITAFLIAVAEATAPFAGFGPAGAALGIVYGAFKLIFPVQADWVNKQVGKFVTKATDATVTGAKIAYNVVKNTFNKEVKAVKDTFNKGVEKIKSLFN